MANQAVKPIDLKQLRKLLGRIDVAADRLASVIDSMEKEKRGDIASRGFATANKGSLAVLAFAKAAFSDMEDEQIENQKVPTELAARQKARRSGKKNPAA